MYPGESLKEAPTYTFQSTDFKPALKPLPIVKANHGLKLRAILDHNDDLVERKAGDIWMLKGPVTYKPRAEVVNYTFYGVHIYKLTYFVIMVI